MIPNKKASILLVLKVLQEYSDEQHFLTHHQIAEKVKKLYGIELERKSIAYSIELLNELGYDINPNDNGKGGWALFLRQFETSEARFLIDAVFSSRVIPAESAIALSDKIQEGLSSHQRKNYGYVYKSTELSRCEEARDSLLNIEILNEAISESVCVRFSLKEFGDNGELMAKTNGPKITVSPYFIVNNLGRYYLLAYPGQGKGERALCRYRVDLIDHLEKDEQSDYVDKESVVGPGFSISRYLDEHIHMLNGEMIDAVVRVEEEIEGRPGWTIGEGIRRLRDWFGKRAYIYKKDGATYAKVRCDASSMFYWIMQYSEEFTLIKPQDRVDEIKHYLRMYLQKYGG